MMDALSNSWMIEKNDAIIGTTFEYSNVDIIKSLKVCLFINDCSSNFVAMDSVDMYLEIARFAERLDCFDRNTDKTVDEKADETANKILYL